MTDPALIIHDLKDRIMAEPDMILEDREVMRALIDADARRQGGNIVDLRGIAMSDASFGVAVGANSTVLVFGTP